jgi:hypothetical protein
MADCVAFRIMLRTLAANRNTTPFMTQFIAHHGTQRSAHRPLCSLLTSVPMIRTLIHGEV